MIKTLLFLLLLSLPIMAKSYHFNEVRYSDALGKSISLHGIISFGDERLKINYEGTNNTLLYEDEELSMYEGEEEIELEESEAVKIAQYFEIILLLYENDTSKLQENFTIQKEGEKTLLIPTNEMSQYIQKIQLQHKKERLHSLQLYLTNDDNIKISIEDEIH